MYLYCCFKPGSEFLIEISECVFDTFIQIGLNGKLPVPHILVVQRNGGKIILVSRSISFLYVLVVCFINGQGYHVFPGEAVKCLQVKVAYCQPVISGGRCLPGLPL